MGNEAEEQWRTVKMASRAGVDEAVTVPCHAWAGLEMLERKSNRRRNAVLGLLLRGSSLAVIGAPRLEILGALLGRILRGDLRVKISCLGICDEVVREGGGGVSCSRADVFKLRTKENSYSSVGFL